jgi:hypothetical protein
MIEVIWLAIGVAIAFGFTLAVLSVIDEIRG